MANLRLLVSEYGANIKAIDKVSETVHKFRYVQTFFFQEGWTLLHACAKNFHLNDCTEMLKYLIEKGLSVEQPGQVKSDISDVLVVALGWPFRMQGFDCFERRLPHEVSDYEPRVFLHSEYVQYCYS